MSDFIRRTNRRIVNVGGEFVKTMKVYKSLDVTKELSKV